MDTVRGLRRIMVFLLAVQSLSGFAQSGLYDWSGATEVRPGILRTLVTVSDPRPMRINAVRVDLSHPQIRLHTTGRHADWDQPCPGYEQYTIETGRQRTADFLTASRSAGMDMSVAVNASPWGPWAELPDFSFTTYYKATYPYADLTGLAVSGGQLVSPANGTRPSIIFYNDWSAEFRTLSASADYSNIQVAAPGFTMVLNAGVPGGNTASAEPRTGYGLSSDSTYLYLMTIDGRQTGVSEGAFILEVGQWLAHFGAWNGANMDGGGSTTLALHNQANNTVSVVNSPSDNPARRVGNNLGVYYDARPAVLSRSPAVLNPSVPAELESVAAGEIEVWNSGGSQLVYSASSDVSWLSLTPAQGTSKGERDRLQVICNTVGMTSGVYQATLFVQDDAGAGSPQTVSVSLTVTPAAGEIPFRESFESFAPGTVLSGTGAWSGAEGDGTVIVHLYTPPVPPGYPLPLEEHTNVLQVIDSIRHPVYGADGTVQVDLMMQSHRGTPEDDPGEETQAALYVDEHGIVHIWHTAEEDSQRVRRWTALSHPPVASGQWVRVSVALDYETCPDGDTFFSPRVNGSLAPTAYGYKAPGNLTSPGPWYLCANTPGRTGEAARRLSFVEARGWVRLDDLSISRDPLAHTGPTATNGVPFVWFDTMGIARDPAGLSAGGRLSVQQAYVAGIDPADPQADFRVLSVQTKDGQMVVRFSGNDSGSQTPYVMEWTDDLVSGEWRIADSTVQRASAPASATEWAEPLRDEGPVFYRPKAVP